MRRPILFMVSLLAICVSGCSSRHTPLQPIDMSLDGAARDEKIPYVDPSLPAGDLSKAKSQEKDTFMKRQEGRLKEQQDEVDDLRRQKFQDDYYKSRYPSN